MTRIAVYYDSDSWVPGTVTMTRILLTELCTMTRIAVYYDSDSRVTSNTTTRIAGYHDNASDSFRVQCAL
jgi:hypothetical protein